MDGDAAPQEADRHHQEPVLWIASDYDPLDIGQRSTSYPHPLAFPEIRIGKDREVAAHESLDRHDLRIGDDLEPVPPLAEHPHQPACLAHLEVGCLIDCVTQEEIASEERNGSADPDPTASRPCLGRRQEEVKALRSELIAHQLLAIAARSEEHTSELQSLTNL